MKLRHLQVALATLCSPWLFVVGRFLSQPGLVAKSFALDPNNTRALEFSLESPVKRRIVRDFRLGSMIAAELDDGRVDEVRDFMRFSESQFLQDVFVALTFAGMRKGYFVEVGVGAGREISNTYMLEKHLGWNGLLVEPNRASHAAIKECRKATLDDRAAAKISGNTVTFEELVDHGVHSRVAGVGVGHELRDVEKRTYEVSTISLTDLLNEKAAPSKVDFMSIDTEGGEADILRGLDFDKYSVGVIAVEHNMDLVTQADLDSLLLPLGYRKVLPHISSVDAWYVHSSISAEGCSWGT